MGDRAKPFATAPGKGSQVSAMLHLGPSVPHTQHLHGPGSSSTRVWEQTAPPRHYSILSTMKGRLNRKAPRVQGLWTHGGARRRQDLAESLVFSQGRSWETPPPGSVLPGSDGLCAQTGPVVPAKPSGQWLSSPRPVLLGLRGPPGGQQHVGPSRRSGCGLRGHVTSPR